MAFRSFGNFSCYFLINGQIEAMVINEGLTHFLQLPRLHDLIKTKKVKNE